ncbi:MAG: pullulanase-type alpha-1,6-glucosidase [Psychromonas sp.]
MESKFNKLALSTMPKVCVMAVVLSLSLTACNNSNDNGNGNGNTEDPTTSQAVQAKDREAVIYSLTAQAKATAKSSSTDKTLHVWNNDQCDALDGDKIDGFENWDQGVAASGTDSFGAYWVLPLTSQESDDCVNFIIRDGLGGQSPDLMLEFSKIADRQGFVPADYSAILDNPTDIASVDLNGASAHWVDAETLLWDKANTASKVELYHSKTADIRYDSTTQTLSGGEVITLNDGSVSEQVNNKFPHLQGFSAFTIPGQESTLKSVLKGQLIAVARDANNNVLALTKVQIAGVLDDLYTGSDDPSANADSEILGAVNESGDITFKVWAPTAQKVELLVFTDATISAIESGYPKQMNNQDGDGIYSLQADAVMGKYYRYRVTVYHPKTDKIETFDVTDPYSMSLSENSLFSQVVDMEDANLQPDGWDSERNYVAQQATDAIIYESHIRDFSNSDNTGITENNGKYLAFTEQDRASMQHLQSLKEAGLTYFHLMPTFDIATVNENPEKIIDINNTVAELCKINATAGVCSSAESSQTLKQLLESYDPASEDAQSLMNDIRAFDSFNWGYDPFHYTVPEGSYASDANGSQRILEFREMVQALQDMGLKVVMDVVYNHTNASGINEKSVLDKIVPGYYHRLNIESGAVEQSTCCDNTASENVMMEKLMIDSLVVWSRDYKINAFRFDLMGHHMKSNMENALAAVQRVDPDTYFYGEGWNFGEVADGQRGENAIQWSMAGTGIGSFSDRLRDAVRGGGPFDGGEDLRTNKGFANAGAEFTDSSKTAELNRLTDLVRLGMAANLKEFLIVDSQGNLKKGQDIDYNGQKAGYAEQPQETINYVSKHDNQTLWDNNQYKIASETSSDDRVRMQNIALSTVLLGQGIPFLHMGSELLRSKSMQRDSYDSGDWYNRVNFDLDDADLNNNWNVGLPRKDKDGDNYTAIKDVIANSETAPSSQQIVSSSEQFKDLLKIRTSSPLFNLTTAEQIMARVDFHNTGEDQVSGVVVMSIDDGIGLDDLDDINDAAVVIINATELPQEMPISGASGFTLHSVQQTSSDTVVQDANFTVAESNDGIFSVPALTTAVFVKKQGDAQGQGLPINDKNTSEVPTYGATTLYVKGIDGEWGNVHGMTFSNYIYSFTLTLAIGENKFKIADADWAAETNFGFANMIEGEGSLSLSDSDGNIQVNITSAGDYTFTLDGSENSSTPTISVIQQ